MAAASGAGAGPRPRGRVRRLCSHASGDRARGPAVRTSGRGRAASHEWGRLDEALPGGRAARVGDRGRGAGPVRLRAGAEDSGACCRARRHARPGGCPGPGGCFGPRGRRRRTAAAGDSVARRRRSRGPRRPRLGKEHAAGCAAGDEPCLRLARAAGREPHPASTGPGSTPARSRAPWTGQRLRSQTTPICSHPRPTAALASLNSLGWRVILTAGFGPGFGQRVDLAAIARSQGRAVLIRPRGLMDGEPFGVRFEPEHSPPPGRAVVISDGRATPVQLAALRPAVRPELLRADGGPDHISPGRHAARDGPLQGGRGSGCP